MPTHYKGTKKETRTLNTFIKLMRSTESLSNRLCHHLNEYNLTISQFGVLESLLHVGPQNQRELGARLLKSGGNITMVIDNLCKNNWVKRTPNPSDRRSMIISLTDSGSAFIEDFFPKHLERIIKEFEILDPEELEQLGELAKKVGTQTK